MRGEVAPDKNGKNSLKNGNREKVEQLKRGLVGRGMMRGLPLILAYSAICSGMVAGAVTLLPTLQAAQDPAAPSLKQGARDHTLNEMELQANRWAERAKLDAVFAEARPPVPMIPSPKPVFVSPSTAAQASSTGTAAAGATTVSAMSPAPPMETRVLRPTSPSAVARSIETDGYKGVRVLGREPDGRWRALALRGSTEVAVLVDDQGRVSAQ